MRKGIKLLALVVSSLLLLGTYGDVKVKAASSNEQVGDSYGSELWCRGTVYFAGGTSIVSSVILDPGGIVPPEV